jgi:glutathione S-transferase
MRCLHWMRFAEGTIMLHFVARLYLRRVGDAAKSMQARVKGMIGDELDLVEAELTRGGHMAGAEFSAADVQMMFPLEFASMPRARMTPRRFRDQAADASLAWRAKYGLHLPPASSTAGPVSMAIRAANAGLCAPSFLRFNSASARWIESTARTNRSASLSCATG